jgi:hypothetical protein
MVELHTSCFRVMHLHIPIEPHEISISSREGDTKTRYIIFSTLEQYALTCAAKLKYSFCE